MRNHFLSDFTHIHVHRGCQLLRQRFPFGMSRAHCGYARTESWTQRSRRMAQWVKKNFLDGIFCVLQLYVKRVWRDRDGVRTHVLWAITRVPVLYISAVSVSFIEFLHNFFVLFRRYRWCIPNLRGSQTRPSLEEYSSYDKN